MNKVGISVYLLLTIGIHVIATNQKITIARDGVNIIMANATMLAQREFQPDLSYDLEATLLREVRLPIANLGYIIERHLEENLLTPDVHTRMLLAQARDCLNDIAQKPIEAACRTG